jgi:GAF domain-containing protein
MADQTLLLQALRSFAASMRETYDVSEMCYELCDRTVEVLSAGGAGVSVVDDHGVLRFVTATSERMVEIERVQEESQQGPCVSAFASGQPIALSSIEEQAPWHLYAATADKLGLEAVVGFPLIHDQQGLGALNVYSNDRREWSEEDLDVIAVFADMATAYLVRTNEIRVARELADQLQGALDSRIVIEQAKGILSGEYGITLDAAFEMLRAQSRNTNMNLSDIAAAVVHMGMRLPA